MDLYSTARGLTRPFVFTEQNRGEVLPIGAHGLIGDGFTCALVRADGAIDWLCLPRFDSPSVFGAVLDPTRGGEMAITPASRPFESLQRYDPDTNVLETLFQVEGQGVVRLTDYMPWTDDPRAAIHEVHRRVECVEGEVELSAVFDPRFDYGRGTTEVEVRGPGVLARGSQGERMVAVTGADDGWEPRTAGGVASRFRLRSGQRRWFVLSWNAVAPEPLSAYRPFQHLRATRHYWREWSRRLRYDGPWRHHVLRSALTLKMLIHAPTGAMVAAPTTSLPEWIGGTRNWDYRYYWTRDAAMSIRAANRMGYVTEARDFFHFVRDTLDQAGELKVMYSIDGSPVPEERVLDHLSGYRGSSPVRIGNGARDQIQLDTAGALLDAAFLYERHEGTLTLRVWRNMRAVVEAVRDRWSEPDHGIWEPRGPTRHNVHSKLMSWLALENGSRLAAVFGDTELEGMWAREAVEVRADVMKHGLDASGHHFITAYGIEEPDAALLLLPIHGFLEPRHPLVSQTVAWLRSELGTGDFLHRYRMDDGVGGEEGAFVLCGFWLAEALALAGDLDRAQAVFTAHAEEASNHLGLLSEEVDPKTGELLGNFPQAFSHLGLINAAAQIDAQLRLRDEGTRKAPELGRRY